jgi:hypothetical protein
MESGSVAFSICVNALRGTAVDATVLVFEFAVEEVALAPTLDLIAFEGALSTVEDGVYATAVVVAFEPADEDPEDA